MKNLKQGCARWINSIRLKVFKKLQYEVKSLWSTSATMGVTGLIVRTNGRLIVEWCYFWPKAKNHVTTIIEKIFWIISEKNITETCSKYFEKWDLVPEKKCIIYCWRAEITKICTGNSEYFNFMCLSNWLQRHV